MVMPIVLPGGRAIGPAAPCFVIAEAGVNHNGDLQRALEMVELAAAAGADAVKFQTFTASQIVTADARKGKYQQRATGSGQTQLEMLQQLELSQQDHVALVEHCRQHQIMFMSTPFDPQSADLLVDCGVTLLKIPSGEVTNHNFLRHLANKQMPLILSTGMCSLGEVEQAVTTLEQADNQRLVLLHCVSSYPAAAEDVNLRAMQTLEQAFQLPVGFSDHTLGLEIAFAAVALGACVLEKHFTLDRRLPGPDHAASLEPQELSALVQGIRRIEAAMGSARKRRMASEEDVAEVARKSIVAAEDIPAGTVITERLLTAKRPGSGLPPSMTPYLLNRVARLPIPAGTILKLEMVA